MAQGKGHGVEEQETLEGAGRKWPLLIRQRSLKKSLFRGPFHVQMIEDAEETISISRRFGLFIVIETRR